MGVVLGYVRSFLVLAIAVSAAGCEEKPQPAKAPAPRAAAENAPAAPPVEPAPPPAPPAAPAEYGGSHLGSFAIGGDGADAARTVAVAPDGAIVVGGYFSGQVDFGAGAVTASGGTDAFVAAYDANGALRWVKAFGGDDPVEEEAVQAVAVDPQGNVYVTGLFNRVADFGGGERTSAGRTDVFVAKYTAAGEHVWSRSAGDKFKDHGHGIAVDSAGNVIVTGYFSGVVNLGGGTFEGQGRADIFLVKYGTDGKHQWSFAYGDKDDDLGRAVAVDWRGDVYLLGEYNGELDLGGGALKSVGNSDVLVAKFDAAGAHQWSRSFGHAFNDFGVGIAADRDGGVAIAGSFETAIDFGGGELKGAGKKDAFLVKLDGKGGHVWSKALAARDNDIGGAVAIDPFGNVAFAGWYWFDLDAGGGALKSAGKDDVVVAKYSASGEHLWSKRFGGAETDFGRGLAFDGDGNLVLVGTFRKAVDFGGGELAWRDSGTVPRGDAYVARFGP